MSKGLGVEVELTGMSREKAKCLVELLFGTKAESVQSSVGYTYYRVKDWNGNKWIIKRDRSICPQERVNNRVVTIPVSSPKWDSYKVEIVSPILSRATLNILYQVLRCIRVNGGLVNSTCAIHVHVDAPSDIGGVVSMLNRYLLLQDKLYKRFNVESARRIKYCKKYCISTPIVVDSISSRENLYELLVSRYTESSLTEVSKLKYFGMNVYSLESHGTIEFRFFNGTLSEERLGEILSWVSDFTYRGQDECRLHF